MSWTLWWFLHNFWSLTTPVLIHFNYTENQARILYLLWKKEYWFEITWGRVNNDRFIVFTWGIFPQIPCQLWEGEREKHTGCEKALFRMSTVCVDSLCGSVWLCAKYWPHLCHFLPSVCDVARPEHSLGNPDTRLPAGHEPHPPYPQMGQRYLFTLISVFVCTQFLKSYCGND